MSIEIKNLNKKTIILKQLKYKLQNQQGFNRRPLGPNGCGKTTTIGMILINKTTSGSVFINEKNIEKENIRTEILEKVNFISPYIELPKKLTIEENLKVYGKMYGVNNLQKKISDLIDELNLGEFKKRKTGELSSGQKIECLLLKH